MPRKTFYDAGAEVLAKWPGSTMYYPGTIVEGYDESTDSYKVVFEKSEVDPVIVLARHVTKSSYAKSWRSRSASPARTPGRGKRRRSRSKSPTRSSRKRSPARQKSPSQRQRKANKSPSPIKGDEKIISKNDAVDADAPKETKEETPDVSRSAHVAEEELEHTIVTRRVTRSVARIQQEVIQHQAAEIKQSADAKEEKEKEERLKQHGWMCEIVALIGIVLFPLALMALYFVIGDKKQAFSFMSRPTIPPLTTFLNWKVFCILGIWYDTQFILTRLPFGQVVTENTKDGEQRNYRLNALFHILVYVPIVAVGIYTKIAFKVAALADEYYLSLAASSILAAWLTVVFVAVNAGFGRNDKDKILTPEDFFVGKEFNPTILGFDFKFSSSRTGYVGWLFLDCLFIINHYAVVKGNVNPAAIFVAASHLIYGVWVAHHERALIRSPMYLEFTYGFAYCLFSLSFMPLFNSIQVLYLVKFLPQMSHIQWAAAFILQIAGIYIFSKSNTEKLEFRTNPKKAMKRDIKVVLTADGKNLLADGWWGRLRHPNYLGDILIAVSWAIPAGCSHLAPWLYPITLVLLLLMMAHDDEKRCSKKYGLSWDEYKSRVKYVIFPYVY